MTHLSLPTSMALPRFLHNCPHEVVYRAKRPTGTAAPISSVGPTSDDDLHGSRSGHLDEKAMIS